MVHANVGRRTPERSPSQHKPMVRELPPGGLNDDFNFLVAVIVVVIVVVIGLGDGDGRA